MIKEKKYYTREELIKLDKEKEFIPLTYDGMFKGIFKKNLDLLKELILSQLELDIDRDICKIELFDSELAKDKMSEYQKTVDIYVRIDNVFVNLEINREYFKNVEKRNLLYASKLYSSMLNEGDDVSNLENEMFVQINLNAVDKYENTKERKKLQFGTDTVVLYGLDTGTIYNSNIYYCVKYLEYYRDLYYNGDEEMDESGLWLVMLASKSFLELYNILGRLFDDDKRERFIREVISMIEDREFFKEWELEKLNELVKYTSEKNLKEDARREGLEEGFEEGHEKGRKEGREEGRKEGREEGRKEGREEGREEGRNELSNEHIVGMLKENIDIEVISRITGKTTEEIMVIKEKLDEDN